MSSTGKKSPGKAKKEAKKEVKKEVKKAAEALFDVDSLDVVLPTSLLSEPAGGECAVLVQIDPQDATLLDFEGAAGAIGRFETEETGGEREILWFCFYKRSDSLIPVLKILS